MTLVAPNGTGGPQMKLVAPNGSGDPQITLVTLAITMHTVPRSASQKTGNGAIRDNITMLPPTFPILEN